MSPENNAKKIKRLLLIKIAKEFFNETLTANIDKIPFEMRPKNTEYSRCCVYKDRAVLKYRIMAILGFAVADEKDEFKTLKEYLAESFYQASDEKILSLIDIACDQCISSRYFVTNACRGCLSRPCVLNCPVNAIKIVNGKAVINNDKCISCGKCLNFCPFNSIIKNSVPCEDICPVNAISRENNQQKIDYNKCINCGKCMLACPFGAITEKSELIKVLHNLKSSKKVIAMIAPAIIGQFAGNIGQIVSALIKIGFSSIVEVASGAETTTAHEVKEYTEKILNNEPLMTTSCCPAYLETVNKHIQGLKPYVSSAKTPMQYTAENIKKENPDSITVFIGPCIAKRVEALRDENTDFTITFEELASIFAAFNIDVIQENPVIIKNDIEGFARGFATSCGVSSAIIKKINNPDIEKKFNGKHINGINKKAVKMLKLYAENKLPGNFLEVMACEGGCVGGPCTIGKVKIATEAVKKFSSS